MIKDIRSNWNRFRNMSFRKKTQHLWTYHRLKFVAAGIVLAVVIISVYSAATQKDTVLTGILLNNDLELSDTTPVTKMTDAFLARENLSKDFYQFLVSHTLSYFDDGDEMLENTYYSVQAISAEISTGGLDFIIGNEEAMNALAYSDYFEDLSTILSPELLELCSLNLLYMDRAILKKMQSTDWTAEERPEFELPDPSNPEGMEDPVPVLVDVSECDYLSDIYQQTSQRILFAVTANSSHLSVNERFLRFLMESRSLQAK